MCVVWKRGLCGVSQIKLSHPCYHDSVTASRQLWSITSWMFCTAIVRLLFSLTFFFMWTVASAQTSSWRSSQSFTETHTESCRRRRRLKDCQSSLSEVSKGSTGQRGVGRRHNLSDGCWQMCGLTVDRDQTDEQRHIVSFSNGFLRWQTYRTIHWDQSNIQ